MNTNDRFNGKGNSYSKYRPSYPKKYIDYLIKENNLNKDSLVFDVGAGTGILTEILLKRGLNVTAVEPNLDMGIFIRDLKRKYTNLQFINSLAENINHNKKEIDLITVVQAFHWFNVDKFKN
ncbi:MAG: methyltransferase domain-containing protein [Clostridium perfringens]|nr:methyltransferase domain-containing protein [Clostridium perfringens]